MSFFRADFLGNTGPIARAERRGAAVSREAYGVRGACSRCRMCGAVRKREQAPRTPYASRGLIPAMPAWGQTRPTPYLITNEDRIALVAWLNWLKMSAHIRASSDTRAVQ